MLADAEGHAKRFTVDNLARGLSEMPVDQYLLAALRELGIALGLDRLLMVLLCSRRIDRMIGFASEGA